MSNILSLESSIKPPVIPETLNQHRKNKNKKKKKARATERASTQIRRIQENTSENRSTGEQTGDVAKVYTARFKNSLELSFYSLVGAVEGQLNA